MELREQTAPIRADVLIIGGGVGGLQAAIEAADAGASVIVLEKADSRRSGNGATGNDHYACYLPEVHGPDFQACVDQVLDTLIGPNQDRVMLEKLLWRSREIVEKWQGYGIDMKPYGPDYIWEGHTLPGRQHFHLKYDGSNQKPALTRAALARGARIRNHTTVIDLITDAEGRFAGAVGVDTSEDEPVLLTFEAKAAVIATGRIVRAFPSSTPQALFNLASCPACGASIAMAYRAGARLVNLDLVGTHAGPKYFERGGKATWIGVVSDAAGESVGPYVKRAVRKLGDPFADVYTGVFADRMKTGQGPTYMDCRTLSEEDLAYMRHCFVTEGDTSINDYLDTHGIDLRRSMVEFGTYGAGLSGGGLDIGLDAGTTLPGLFAAGNACGNARGDITCASVYGMIAGESAAAWAAGRGFAVERDERPVVRARALCQAFLTRGEGATWQGLNAGIQNIMRDYAGAEVRTDSLLTAGLRYLRQLRATALEELSCANAHELMRTLETLDVLDYCEATVLCARNRRETRGGHKRPDYPYTNVLLNGCFQTIERMPRGGVRMRFRKSVNRLDDPGAAQLPFIEQVP